MTTRTPTSRPRSDLAQIRADVREARDGVIKLTAAFSAQDTNARIDALTASMKGDHAALRQDVVAALTTVRSDVRDIDIRVESLEASRSKSEGGSALMKLIRDNLAWAIALIASFIALFDRFSIPPSPPPH